MRKNIVLMAFILLFGVAVVLPSLTNAALWNPTEKQKAETSTFTEKAGFAAADNNTAYTLVASFINTFLGLLGIVFLLLIVYGGFKWMTAQGAEEDVTKAKNIITQAVIGLVIIMGAYAISRFVIGNIQSKTLNTGMLINLSTRLV